MVSRALTSSSAVRRSVAPAVQHLGAHQRDDVLRRLQARGRRRAAGSAPRPAARRSSPAGRRRSGRRAAPPPSPRATACSAPRRTAGRRPPRGPARQNGRSGHSGGPPKTSFGASVDELRQRPDAVLRGEGRGDGEAVLVLRLRGVQDRRRRGRPASRRAPRASPPASRGRSASVGRANGQRRPEVVDDDVDDALLQGRAPRPRACRSRAAPTTGSPARRAASA